MKHEYHQYFPLRTVFSAMLIMATVFCLADVSPINTYTAPQGIIQKKDTVRYQEVISQAGVAFYQNSVIVLSNSLEQLKMLPGHVSFGTKRTYIMNPGNFKSNLIPFVNAKAFPYDPAGMVLSPGGNVLYYTMNDSKTAGKNNIYSVDVVEKASSIKGLVGISHPSLLPFCIDDSNDQHPAISAGGDFLIFASDRNGGTGGYDLYFVERYEGEWSQPVNLGQNLNTSEDELYPFLDKENNLYFSSGGFSGYGMLDIYLCKFSGEKWEQPVNLMKGINSEGRDIAFRVNNRGSLGFYITLPAGSNNSILFRLESEREGELSAELLSLALTEYENIYGTGFKLSEQKSTPLPGKLFEDELLAGKVARNTKEEINEPAIEKAEKATDEIPPDDPQQPSGEMDQQANSPGEPDDSENVSENSDISINEKVKEEFVADVPRQDPEPDVEEKESVIFRVQISSTRNPTNKETMEIKGEIYPVFEYLYKGAYRQTVGGYSELDQAKNLQGICRNSGFDQAFVAAFINDERVTDPAVFRK